MQKWTATNRNAAEQVEVMLKSQDGAPVGSSAADALQGFPTNDTRSAGGLAPPAASLSKNGSISQSSNERSASNATSGGAGTAAAPADFSIQDPTINLSAAGRDMDRWQFNADSPPRSSSLDEFNFAGRLPEATSGMDSNSSWEIIQMHLDEPLPEQSRIDELYVYHPLLSLPSNFFIQALYFLY